MELGTKLVCITKGQWFETNRHFFFWTKRKFVNGPDKDEIVTLHSNGTSPGHIYLAEYLHCGQFPKKYFKPLVSDERLQEELSSITVPNNK